MAFPSYFDIWKDTIIAEDHSFTLAWRMIYTYSTYHRSIWH